MHHVIMLDICQCTIAERQQLIPYAPVMNLAMPNAFVVGLEIQKSSKSLSSCPTRHDTKSSKPGVRPAHIADSPAANVRDLVMTYAGHSLRPVASIWTLAWRHGWSLK